MKMINKFAILILNKKIQKNYLQFWAEAFQNIISFSMLYHITKFHLTTNFLCIITILTIHTGHCFKIHKGHCANQIFISYYLRKELNVQNLFVHLTKVLIYLWITLQDFFLDVPLLGRYIRYSIQIHVQHDYLYV